VGEVSENEDSPIFGDFRLSFIYSEGGN